MIDARKDWTPNEIFLVNLNLPGLRPHNWPADVKKPDWPKIVQVIEVTLEKKAVWAINEWTNPDLGPASCIQMLDEAGKDEEQEPMS